uniref:Acyl carrier protein n=1 Tax=Quercus lobata TaxID=97700 RepID=A0A7N2LEQ9_QUELO
MALRAAIRRHVRVPVKTLTLTGRKSQPWGPNGASLRFLSSHGDDHLSKDEVIERVLSVIKSFPKVDPSQELHLQNTMQHDPMYLK